MTKEPKKTFKNFPSPTCFQKEFTPHSSHSYQKSSKVLAGSYLKLEKNKLNEIE